MAIKFNRPGYEHAVRLIEADETDTFDTSWTEAQPTPTERDNFINTHAMSEYGLWFLGTDDQFPKETKEHYVYPHGDLKVVQKSALADTLDKAKKQGNREIADAAERLLAELDER